MRIKKTSETTPRTSQTVNQYSESTQDSYSCDYINKAIQRTIYTELDYIQTTGTQYIDTGIIPQGNNYRFDIQFKLNSAVTTDTKLFGCHEPNNTSSANYVCFATLSSKFRLGLSSSLVTSPNWTLTNYSTDTNLHTICFNKNGKVLFDNNEITNYINIGDIKNSFYLGAINYTDYPDATGPTTGNVKIYNCKIYDNDNLIYDLIPVKRKSDLEICMYDKVNKTFFTNAGTGVFIAGPEI